MTDEQPSIGHHYCKQPQPHAAHEWVPQPVYGKTAYVMVYQCAGLLPSAPGADSVAQAVEAVEFWKNKVAALVRVHGEYFNLDVEYDHEDAGPEPEDVWRFDRDFRKAMGWTEE